MKKNNLVPGVGVINENRLDEEIDMRTAAAITGLAVGTIRSYVAQGVFDAVTKRPEGHSKIAKLWITHRALIEYISTRKLFTTIPLKPLSPCFFATYRNIPTAQRVREYYPVAEKAV